jgi:hypothetical protein
MCSRGYKEVEKTADSTFVVLEKRLSEIGDADAAC